MPIHDRIGRALSKGIGAIGGFAGDVFGAVAQQAPGVVASILASRVTGALGQAGGAPTTLPIGGFAGPIILPQQRTFPGVPGEPLGGALTLPRGDPMGLPVAALPGGAPVIQAGLGDVFGGVIGSFLQGQALTPSGAACPTLFRQAPQALRPVSMFHITNPSTGREVWYRNVGQPVLWSGDFAACRRVAKVGRKARSRAGGKR